MWPASFAVFSHPRSQPKIDLQLLTRRAFHPPERQFLRIHPTQDKAAHRKIAADKLAFDYQVLINPLDRQTPLQSRVDLLPPRVTQTGRTRISGRAGLRVAG